MPAVAARCCLLRYEPFDFHRLTGGNDRIDSASAYRVCLIVADSRERRQQNPRLRGPHVDPNAYNVCMHCSGLRLPGFFSLLSHSNMVPRDPIGGQEQTLADSKDDLDPHVPTEPYYIDDLKDFGWLPIAGFIIIAGCAYPIVLGAGAFFFMLLHEGPQVASPVGLIFVVPMFVLGVGTVGIIWTSFVTVITLPVLHLFLWSMKLRIGIVKLGAFAGGLVGFLAVLPWAFSVSPELISGNTAQLSLVMMLGPGLATILGQLGGAKGGLRAEWHIAAVMASRRALARIRRLRKRSIYETSQRAEPDESLDGIDTPRFRFRIIHILWLGVWLSLLLTIIRLSGIPYELILPMLVTWLVYQAATLAIGGKLMKYLSAAPQPGRQTRST
jgi:hypothetical protein